jgi:hypothetical protein
MSAPVERGGQPCTGRGIRRCLFRNVSNGNAARYSASTPTWSGPSSGRGSAGPGALRLHVHGTYSTERAPSPAVTTETTIPARASRWGLARRTNSLTASAVVQARSPSDSRRPGTVASAGGGCSGRPDDAGPARALPPAATPPTGAASSFARRTEAPAATRKRAEHAGPARATPKAGEARQVELWLDDFGAGHSSLEWLNHLPRAG